MCVCARVRAVLCMCVVEQGVLCDVCEDGVTGELWACVRMFVCMNRVKGTKGKED